MTNARKWLTRGQVADLTGFSVKTLANWASLHSGPPYIKVGGKCRYDAKALARWQDELPKVA